MKNTTNKVLLRMRKAYEDGRGVRISHAELCAFSVELMGEWWENIGPDGRPIHATQDNEACANEGE